MITELTEATFNPEPQTIELVFNTENKWLGIPKYVYNIVKIRLSSTAQNAFFVYFPLKKSKELFDSLVNIDQRFSFNPIELKQKLLGLKELKYLSKEETREIYDKLPKKYNCQQALKRLKTSEYNFEETLSICMIVVKWALEDPNERSKICLDFLLVSQQKYVNNENKLYFWDTLDDYFYEEIKQIFPFVNEHSILTEYPIFQVAYYSNVKVNNIILNRTDQFDLFEQFFQQEPISLELCNLTVEKADIIRIRDFIKVCYLGIKEINLWGYTLVIDQDTIRKLLSEVTFTYNIRMNFYNDKEVFVSKKI